MTTNYVVHACSTERTGRMILSARDQHIVADAAARSGGPGEAIMPAELFLGGVASCGVSLVQAVARDMDLAVTGLEVTVEGEIDKEHPVRGDVTIFNRVRLRFRIDGVSEAEAARLVGRFQET